MFYSGAFFFRGKVCYTFPLKQRGNEMLIERSEFKGRPMLVIKNGEDDKFPFSFGLTKAKKILESIEEIKKFVDENQ